MIVKLKGFIENLDDYYIDLDVRGVVYRILMGLVLLAYVD